MTEITEKISISQQKEIEAHFLGQKKAMSIIQHCGLKVSLTFFKSNAKNELGA